MMDSNDIITNENETTEGAEASEVEETLATEDNGGVVETPEALEGEGVEGEATEEVAEAETPETSEEKALEEMVDEQL